jgi:hypothetical protein
MLLQNQMPIAGPMPERLVSRFSGDKAFMFVCGVPKDAAALSRVLTVERDLFGSLSIPESVAHEIFRVRPEIFSAITGPTSSVAAYSTIYPLKKQWAQALIAGDIAEPDLKADMLLTRHDSHQDACIYIGSVVVDSSFDPLTKSILLSSILSWRTQQLRDASIRRLSVVMTGVSKEGERLIRYLGAKQLNDGTTRKDGYAIYGRTVTQGFLSRATSTIERCLNNRTVKMDLNFLPTPLAQMQTMRFAEELVG